MKKLPRSLKRSWASRKRASKPTFDSSSVLHKQYPDFDGTMEHGGGAGGYNSLAVSCDPVNALP
jgi:hypothetical protein